MKEVVINNCFGGFSLSPLAVKRMAELQGKDFYVFKHSFEEKKYISVDPFIKDKYCGCLFYFSVPNPNEYLKENPNAYEEIYLEDRPEDRSDPLLIQIVKELGDKANGSCAKLKIVEIPDDVEYYIDEYDGNEHVAEKHRKWY